MSNWLSVISNNNDRPYETQLVANGFRPIPSPHSNNNIFINNHEFATSESIRLVFNGSFYNKSEVAKSLDLPENLSDSILLLSAYKKMGDRFASMIEGPYTIILDDEKRKEVLAYRDKIGQKTCYYLKLNDQVIISDNISKLISIFTSNISISAEAVSIYLTHNGSPIAPNTFYQNLFELRPGSILKVSKEERTTSEVSFYSFDRTASHKFEDWQEELREELKISIDQILSKFPANFAVSGGLDSSTLVGLARDLRPGQKINAFSVQIKDPSHDDSNAQKLILDKFGAQGNTIILDRSYVSKIIPELLKSHNFPITPTSFGRWALYKKLNEAGINNILEGWGADQLFAGYESHHMARLHDLAGSFQWLKLSKELQYYQDGPNNISKLYPILKTGIANNKTIFKARVRLFKLGLNTKYRSKEILEKASLNSDPYFRQIVDFLGEHKFENYYDRFSYLSIFGTGLPFGLGITHKSASANNVNIHLPFLNSKIVKLALNLPADFKINQGQGKYILRKTMNKILPGIIVNRDSKRGLEIPDANWFGDEFNSTANILREFKSEFINMNEYAKIVDQYLAGNYRHTARLWRAFVIIQLEYKLKHGDIIWQK